MQFDAVMSAIPKSLLSVSGKVFYAGRDAFSNRAALYVLGANPGGDPGDAAESSIGAHTRWVSTTAPSSWSAYRDESWKGKAPGTHGMQPRMLHMFSVLGLDPGHVPSSNLVFQRSSREAQLDDFASLADLCWPFHQYVLDTLRPRVVVCLGKTAGSYVCDKVEAHKRVGTFTEANSRRWQSESFRATNGLAVVVGTHPSIANWCNPKTDPTGLVISALQAV